MEMIHTNAKEHERLLELQALEILDTQAEPEYDRIVEMVAQLTDCPVSLISLVDRERQWFKAKWGLEVSETSRDNSFCDNAIRRGDTFVVADASKDERFKDNPLVVSAPGIRFYAAKPLITSKGFRIGTLCAIDVKPRDLSQQQLDYLDLLSQQAMRLLELRLANRQLNEMRVALEQARDEAERANKAKSSFLANMSHEIRTPLSAILGFTELMREDNLSSAEQEQFLATIARNGQNLKKLVDDILDLSKVESGKLEIESLSFSPRALLEEVVELFRIQAQMKGIDLYLQVSAKAPGQVVSDPNRLRQIMVNLIGNAVKFTEKGRVKVTLGNPQMTSGGMKIPISVSDTGIGIQGHQHEKLFKPFSQADSTTSRKFGGTGLGLVLSKRLANSLGGDLYLDLAPSEMTTTFVVEIRAQESFQKKVEERKDPSHSLAIHFSDRKFLVVDDSEDNLNLARRLLEKKGAQVQVACNGAEALRRVSEEVFDLILMDIQMPEMDGYEATRLLREQGFQKPIIALTAHAMKSDLERAQESGCNAHIAKPLDTASLFETISLQL